MNKTVLRTIVVCLTVVLGSSPIPAQSDREIDCNGVCEALGLSPTQCWDYIHSWHNSRQKCTNWSWILDETYSSVEDINGLGSCSRTWDVPNYPWDAAGELNCYRDTSGNHCVASGDMFCGGRLQVWGLSCDGGNRVPRVTVERDAGYCTTDTETHAAECNHLTGEIDYRTFSN